MENYIRSPKAETFALSAFDMQGSFSNIPYVFFYENAQGETDFMSDDLLKESLATTLQDFPILLGHIRARGTGKIDIVVEPDNLNIPEFLVSSCDTITYEDIKAKDFAWASWPEGVVTVGGYALPSATDGEIKLMNVHVVRLKANTGLLLFVNIPHYAVDGCGYFSFIHRWAATAAALSRKTELPKTPKLLIDRACIGKRLPTERRAIDSLSESLYSTPNFLCDTLAWLAPTTLGKLLSKLGSLSKGEAHFFHISKSTLESLRVSASQHIPAGSRLSNNDLLVALLSKTYVQSQPQPEPKAGWFTAAPNPAEDFFVRVPCDARPRLGGGDEKMSDDEVFTGNFLIPMFVRSRIAELATPSTPETLASAALIVRQTIGSIDAALVSGFHDVISRYPSGHMRPLAFASRNQTTSMVTTSQVGFGIYEADFGSGRPGFVSLTSVFEGSYTLVAILETAPYQEKGVNVLITSNKVAIGNILKNEFWRETATLLW
ncbi:transferase family protein [Xylariaceae sp. FL0594]|nr:transferase family protein [Xylariaceae sp. FL0594]